MLVRLFAVDAWMRWVAGFVARISGEIAAVFAWNVQEQIALIHEVGSIGGGRHMRSGVHANGIAGARFDTIAAKDATEFVDHETFRIAFVSITRITRLIFSGIDMNALGGACG